MSKAAFRYALHLRYGLQLEDLPTNCVCGDDFTTDHALNCPTGGYPSIRHNQLRDLLASLMEEVSVDVQAEPQLQPLSGKVFERSTTTTKDESRLDIRAQGFWDCRQQRTFFDVRVLTLVRHLTGIFPWSLCSSGRSSRKETSTKNVYIALSTPPLCHWSLQQ